MANTHSVVLVFCAGVNTTWATENTSIDRRIINVSANDPVALKTIQAGHQSKLFISRGNFGSTWTDEFYQLPASVRFFAGGSQSVRGYAYNSLGPVNENGQVVGGRQANLLSLQSLF